MALKVIYCLLKELSQTQGDGVESQVSLKKL